MDYEKSKELLSSTKRKVINVKNEIRETEDRIESINDQKRKEASTYHERVEAAKDAALAERITVVCKPYKEKISATQDRLKQLEQKHNCKMAELTEDNVMQQFSEQTENYSEIVNAMNVLSDKLDDTLGQRFKNELLSQLKTQEIKLEPEQLEGFVKYFNDVNDKIERMNKKPDFSLADLTKSLPMNSKAATAVMFLVFVATIAWFRVLLPIYVLLLCLSFVRNLIKHYEIHEIILTYKSCSDNIEQINEMLKNQALAELDRRRDAACNVYNRSKDKLVAEQEKLQQSLAKAEAHAKATFEFDESEISASYRISMSNIENQIAQYVRQKQKLTDELDTLERDAASQEAMLKKIINEIPRQYLDPTKIGNDTIFDTNFIIDIDDGKPIFFNHPKKSTLFLYDSVNDAFDFIKLICMQVRKRMNAYAYSVVVCDKVYMGSPLRPFVSQEYPQLFSIAATETEIADCLKDISDALLKRSANIMATFKNIDEYNDAMIKSDSVPESYQLIFFINPSETVLGNEAFTQVTQVGGEIGIYNHVFMQKDNFFDLGDRASKLLSTVSVVYTIQDGKITTKAKNFVEEKMIKKSGATAGRFARM